MTSADDTSTNIQSHLYSSFLKGYIADVALHTKGPTWEAVYQLHRVVLIQAGFFRSLFTAGFLESNRQTNGASYFSSPPDKVYVRFDDENITRAAFEICIARLYGGGPDLYFLPSLLPTTAYPLTPALCTSQQDPQCPPNQHPATPRFLLSLLATSIYLSIPSITSRALSMIISSIGPYTVIRYLDFATGKGIGPPAGDDPESAVGLEHIGKPPLTRQHSQASSESIHSSATTKTDDLDITHKLSNLDFDPPTGEVQDQFRTTVEEPGFNYGGIGDKVGEACACWLMRWGADILPYEELPIMRPTPETPSMGDQPSSRDTISSSQKRSSGVILKSPAVWAKGGLTAAWVRTVISSNDFFVKGEFERYEFAARVVDIRRRDGLDENEESEWRQLFLHGIHYCHMTFEELVTISQDVSPVNGHPYLALETLQAAHWTQSLLRQRIVTRSHVSGGRAGSPPPRNKEIGITLDAADLRVTLVPDNIQCLQSAKLYYPVPDDSSQRIGDSDNAFANLSTSAEQLLGNVSHSPDSSHSIPSQANFFGILTPLRTANSCLQDPDVNKTRWSPYPPFRFGVEFWGIGRLLEKSRLYSQTVWYAGSLFNVYVQVVRKKGIQLGVYLHRQSTVDPLPRPSAPSPVPTRGERILNSSAAQTSPRDIPSSARPMSPSRSYYSLPASNSVPSVGLVIPGSPRLPPSPSHLHRSASSSPGSTPPPASIAPQQPYRDPRAAVLTYFTISCISSSGTSLSRFSSSPDQFSIGQSWGWKSSSLRIEEYEDVNAMKGNSEGREVSLRATVLIGLV
ncbi:hypothetical protein BU17DRAFT_84115 [Hysterangium stoloniferum]|nr:hypothetical protein BU17DRAFT_84115 [Hysterangium stoloniferum]